MANESKRARIAPRCRKLTCYPYTSALNFANLIFNACTFAIGLTVFGPAFQNQQALLSVVGVIAGLLVLMHTVNEVVFMFYRHHRISILEYGRSAVARVLEKRRGLSWNRRYRVLCTYSIDGDVLTEWAIVAPQLFRSYSQGDEIKIKVHPDVRSRWVVDCL